MGKSHINAWMIGLLCLVFAATMFPVFSTSMLNTVSKYTTTTTVTTTVAFRGLDGGESDDKSSDVILPIIQSDGDGKVELSIYSEQTDYKANDDFTVNIMISPEYGMNIAGFQLDLTFDASKLYIRGVKEGDYFRQGVNITSFGYGYKDINTLFIMGFMASPDVIYNNDSGSLVALKCTALGNFKLNDVISLSKVVVGNNLGQALPYDLN